MKSLYVPDLGSCVSSVSVHLASVLVSYQGCNGRLQLLNVDIVALPLGGRGLLLDLCGSRATCDSRAGHVFSAWPSSDFGVEVSRRARPRK